MGRYVAPRRAKLARRESLHAPSRPSLMTASAASGPRPPRLTLEGSPEPAISPLRATPGRSRCLLDTVALATTPERDSGHFFGEFHDTSGRRVFLGTWSGDDAR
jgi:hypothetical protein